MRYLVLSDMHANWAAFETVLEAYPPSDFDRVLVLGDLVGYGARPNEVVEAVRGLSGDPVVIRGNHDKVASGIDSDEYFNPAARSAARWTRGELSESSLDYVRELPAGPIAVGEGVTICHGSPQDEDAYVLSADEAQRSFMASDARIVLFGHTHVTCVFGLGSDVMEVDWGMDDGEEIELEAGRRYLINPGSVGQPRDSDPRAACLTLDTERDRVVWHRVEYPIEKAQREILQAELPYFLAERLASGV